MLNSQMDLITKIFAAVVCCAAANGTCLSQTEGCKWRDLPVIVRDSHGLPIEDLLPSDFAAKTKGREIKISSVDTGASPQRVVMLLDTSGSMHGLSDSEEWQLAIAILGQFANAFSRHGQMAFLSFDTVVHQNIGFSDGNAGVLGELKKMKDGQVYSAKDIKGRTALFDSIHKGLQLLPNPSPADVVLVVTDGGDNASKLKQAQLEKELATTGVRFYAILLLDAETRFRSRSPEEMQGPQVLNELAEATGGEVFGPVGYRSGHYLYFSSSKFTYSDDTSIDKALLDFYQGLFHLKTLKLELPAEPSKKPMKIELKLSESAQHKWKSAVISYPERLLPCGAKPN